jgi:hypothetical protein
MDSSALPAWLQAVGGLGAFATTVWLAWITLRYVRAAEKAAAAGRESQVAIARTLLEDVKRIRGELGPRPEGETVPPLADIVVPRVHSWLHPVIPQIALSNAAVVGAFMALERCLENFDVALEAFTSARNKRDEVMSVRDSLYHMYDVEAKKPGASKPEEVGTYLEASHDAEVAEQNVRTAMNLAAIRYRTCHAQLDNLEGLLGPLATLPSTEEHGARVKAQ